MPNRRRPTLVPAFAAMLVLAGSGRAATFVAEPSDSPSGDALPGDGDCRTAAGGCTLAAALEETEALPGADVVLVVAGAHALPSGSVVRDELALVGVARSRAGDWGSLGGLIVEGALTVRGLALHVHLIVDAGGRVWVEDATIGALVVEGGEAEARHAVLGDAQSPRTQGLVLDGGVARVTRSRLRHVTVELGELLLEDSSIEGAFADDLTAIQCGLGLGGGALTACGGVVTLRRCLLRGNHFHVPGSPQIANVVGGAVAVGAGTVSLESCTITQNTLFAQVAAPLGGCGVFASGGGIGVRGGTVSVVGCTITDNAMTWEALCPGAGVQTWGAGIARNGGDVTLAGSVVAGNAGAPTELSGLVTQVGVNVFERGAVGPLADNGGPTASQLPAPGGSAMDAAAEGPATDQRGVARPQGLAFDVGAVEACAGTADADGDRIADACDRCPLLADDGEDRDGDAVPDACDDCPDVWGPTGDADADGVGDACDLCPMLATHDNGDADADAVGDACDACPRVPDPAQEDGDSDGAGDACDCAPVDPASAALPREVAGLRVSRRAGDVALEWSAQVLGASGAFDVVAGALDHLASDRGFARAECAASATASSSLVDTAAGSRWFLVRARNGCGVGTWGDSAVAPDPRDALDAGPCP